MDSGGWTSDFARDFVIQKSSNGTSWTTVATGKGNNRFVSILFTQQNARYLRIQLTSGFNFWWSLAELNVYSTAD